MTLNLRACPPPPRRPPAHQAPPCRDAGHAAPRFARFLSRLQQACTDDLEDLRAAALAATAVTACLSRACGVHTPVDPPQQAAPSGSASRPLTPAEAVAACGWAAAVITQAPRLLQAAQGSGKGAWNPERLLTIMSACCATADELLRHMHNGAHLPHVAQLWEGPARPEVHGRFAHAALQAALALDPHAGKQVGAPGHARPLSQQFLMLTLMLTCFPAHLAGESDDAEAINGWAITLVLLGNIARRQLPRELGAWQAVDPGALASLARLGLAHLGCMARQAQRPMPQEQLEEAMAAAASINPAAAPLDAAEQLPPAAQRLADSSWDAAIRCINALFTLPASKQHMARQVQQAWQAAPGSDMAAVLQLADCLPGRVSGRLPEGLAQRIYACALVSAWDVALIALVNLLLGGQLALFGLQPEGAGTTAPLLTALRSKQPATHPEHLPRFEELCWEAAAAVPLAAGAAAASLALVGQSVDSASPFVKDRLADPHMAACNLGLGVLNIMKPMCEHPAGACVRPCAAVFARRSPPDALLRCRLLVTTAAWCFDSQRPPAQWLPADLDAATWRTTVLLAAGEAGLRLHHMLAQQGSTSLDLLQHSGFLSSEALQQFGALQAALLEQLQQGGAAVAEAIQPALRAAAGLSGTLLKLLQLLQSTAGEEAAAPLRRVLIATLGLLPLLLKLLLQGGITLRQGVPLSTAR